MSKTFTNTTKCCATCANWAGCRQAVYNNSSVETDSPSVRGKCYVGAICTVIPGPTASDGYNCSKYQKWGALR